MSLPDARDIADELTARQVRLNLGGSVYDPTDAVGRLLFNVLAMVAELDGSAESSPSSNHARKRTSRSSTELVATPALSSPSCSALRVPPSTERCSATRPRRQGHPPPDPLRCNASRVRVTTSHNLALHADTGYETCPNVVS